MLQECEPISCGHCFYVQCSVKPEEGGHALYMMELPVERRNTEVVVSRRGGNIGGKADLAAGK